MGIQGFITDQVLVDIMIYLPVACWVATEHGPFIVDLLINNGDV